MDTQGDRERCARTFARQDVDRPPMDLDSTDMTAEHCEEQDDELVVKNPPDWKHTTQRCRRCGKRTTREDPIACLSRSMGASAI